MLIYGIAAELVGGMAAITGAFLAGLMFSRSPEKEVLSTGFQTIGYGFFIPIFFVSIGLNLNLRELQSDALILFGVISVLAIAGKWLGAWLGALWAGFSRKEAAQLGAGMISRGEVGLIVASVGLTQNLVSQAEFSAVIGMVVVTTLVTPFLLRALFPSQPNPPLDQKQQKGEKVLE
jgi:Kef-type K+ transport system membrane component KefB